MSINYYSVKRCTHCGHSDILHIGKSAMGWCFALATHTETGGPIGLRSLEDWQRFLRESPDRHVEDEYGRAVSYDKLMSIITERGEEGTVHSDSGCNGPDAVHGPRGLWRQRLDGRRCIGHGAGTWDLMGVEFS